MDPVNANPVNAALHALLREAAVDYRTVQHEPTPTSADSARARGEELKVGGKALLIKTGDDFRLFVLSAACSLDSGALKRHFGVKKTRFADAGELERLTGLVPGSVPPFGRPILPLDLFVDPSVLANERIAFNAGLLTESIIMPVADYVRVAKPLTLEFAAPAEPK
ncbi:MAG TPA: YbaK/EbsC family protein [Pirellulales bacterium]|jgi:Ala-tRNA(Pro) deacylase|nr:YbaK/EbsC family protein [Pirellulales bacterium]